MTRYALLPHLSYGLVEDQPIFLDLRADSYFEVDAGLRRDLADLEKSDGMLTDEAASRLLAAGLVAVDPDGRTAATRTRVPATGLEPGSPLARVAPGELAEVAGLVGTAVLHLRFTPLEVVLSRRAAPCAFGNLVAVRIAAARFDVLRRRIPWPRRCLPDSIALAWFLRRRSLSATMVFGVTIAPFAAHCWLQDPARIFNDDADTVAGFTPVLEIRV